VPVITAAGTLLSIASTYTNYQWIKNGTSITGATNNTYTVTSAGTYKVAVVTPGGCMDTSLVYVSNLSVGSVSSANDIQIYPNPSNGIVNIMSPVAVNIVLNGIDGRMIEKASNVKQLDLSHLPNGVYLLSVFDENGVRLKTERVDRLGD
jgi:hypothetical protein